MSIATLREVLEMTKEATRIERERCIRLIGSYLTGEIKSQSELREKIESGEDAERQLKRRPEAVRLKQ
jgi:hypothetical protein